MSDEQKDSKKKGKKVVKLLRKAKQKPKQPEASATKKLQAKYDSIDASQIKTFADFPLSAKTLKGLRQCGYHKPTDIQRQTIGLGLQGKDILGAAQTGTGKTLAFLIPLIEKLYCKLWTSLDGLGALVITPTRELAYQIFQTLRAVGKFHDFSAGLIIGGKDLKFERTRMDQCNIIICTPGRLLQHMDENPLFDCVNLQILILDEADRCLDMGFEQTMNAIIANLPPKRQTLLFSATQTKSVKDLVRLSLKDPSYINAYEHSENVTPKELIQNYVVCELQDKLSILWSFVKNHLKNKTIVFFSSCKQTKYMYEIFCKLRPGVSLLALYGTLHQIRRVEIYESFCRKDHAVLFATDLAARGLDFPQVNWVIQVDCPEDVTTYIHRVGRTARFLKGGQSLLMLLPREIKMVDKLMERKIPVEKIDINPMKLNNPVRKMEAYLAKNPELKASAQRAFVSYAKAVFLMKDKEIFDVQSLNTTSFANSLGLAIPPRIRFLQRLNAKTDNIKKGNNNTKNKIYFNDDASDNWDDKIATNAGKNDSDDSGVSADAKPQPSSSFHVSDSDDSDDGAILKVKRKDHDIELPTNEEIADLNLGRNINKKPLTKAAAAKKLLKKKIIPNKKIVFDDDGDAVNPGTREKKSELALQYENEDEGGIDIEKAKMVLKEEDKFDKQLFKQKVKAKHKEKKRKLKEKKKREEEENDEFGESESGEEPDLSWLPDPDQIYGEKTEEEVEKLGKDMHANMHEEEEIGEKEKLKSVSVKEKLPRKRKLKEKDNNLDTASKRKKKQKIRQIGSLLEPDEVEELAIMLLRNK